MDLQREREGEGKGERGREGGREGEGEGEGRGTPHQSGHTLILLLHSTWYHLPYLLPLTWWPYLGRGRRREWEGRGHLINQDTH